MNAIELRRATHEDAPALAVLHVASWHETYAGLVPHEMLAGLSVDTRAAVWSQVLANPEAFEHATVFLAEDEGRIVGFGAGGGQRDPALAAAGFGGEIGAVYVYRSHQKRGVGRAIMGALARALTRAGHSGASLWVLRENAQARLFYEHLGGEIVGEKKEEHPAATLVEIAYGWRDLARLQG